MKNAQQAKPARERVKFYIEKESKWVYTSMILMVMSAVFRLIGCWSGFSDSYFAVTQIALPLACNLLFILVIMTMGKKFFFLSSVPVVLGVVFFILKSFTFESWIHTVLCVLLYVLVALVYTATVFGFIPTKWFLLPLFGLPFLYHVFVEDAAAIRNNTMSFSAGMQEMSVLCIMLSLLCIAFAMKKRKPLIEGALPKIKDPVVIVPEKQPEPPAPAPAQPGQGAEITVSAEAVQENAEENDTGDSNDKDKA